MFLSLISAGREMEYTPDHAAKAAKQKEIEALLATFGEGRRALALKDAKQLVDTFITITPPLDPPVVMELLVMSSLGRGGGSSRKPGNIRLNWRQLFELCPTLLWQGQAPQRRGGSYRLPRCIYG